MCERDLPEQAQAIEAIDKTVDEDLTDEKMEEHLREINEGSDVAMQVRCLHCLREQYVLAVLTVSLGLSGCTWCGKKSEPMTHAAYRAAITKARDERG